MVTILFGNSGNPLTVEAFPVLGPGGITADSVQGGFRYQRITLAAPGTVTLGARLNVASPSRS